MIHSLIYMDLILIHTNTRIYMNKQEKDFMEKAVIDRVITPIVVGTPAADVVEVVRCKDCRLNVANMEKDSYDTTDYSGEDIVCSYFMTDGLEPTDFCNHGERKDDTK